MSEYDFVYDEEHQQELARYRSAEHDKLLFKYNNLIIDFAKDLDKLYDTNFENDNKFRLLLNNVINSAIDIKGQLKFYSK